MKPFSHPVPSPRNRYSYTYQLSPRVLAQVRMPPKRDRVTPTAIQSSDPVIKRDYKRKRDEPSQPPRQRFKTDRPPRGNRGGRGSRNNRGSRGRGRGTPLVWSPPPSRNQPSNQPDVTLSNDVWTIPNSLLLTFQSFPWVQYFKITDGSWVFPKNFEFARN